MNVLVVFPGFRVNGGMTTVVKSFEHEAKKNDINTFFLETYSDKSKLLALFYFIYAVFKSLYYFIFCKVDLVHIHSASKGSFYRKSIFCLLSGIFKVPVLVHMHGGGFKEFYASVNRIALVYINFIFKRKVDYLVVLTESWKKWFDTKLVLKNPAVVLSNAVNVSVDSRKSRTNKVSKFVFVGRVVEDKGISDLLYAFAKIKVSNNTIVEFVGDGDLNKYKELAENLGFTDKVLFSGWLSRSETIERICSSDALILPSYKEGLPMVILEAMACKTAVLATNVGGIPDVIYDGVNGLLVNPGNIDLLAETIDRLVNQEGLHSTLVDNAYQDYLDKYSLDVVFIQLISIYKRMAV
ncbi:glycosyltransferase family 4 protein [Vibrio sp. 05-20-BW147]|uniref:glycosyltransferase family 4 protein n=1 Tax=Vibrio sp. 05-20-BW147 TaxID=2575834 RepID=UPI001593F5E8|nr:glycosyltransferase family 4 protein [Vibrio sp. 05-20-BW147]NVC63219.1 glycosyltransferase family 4 protein [Vibrio sp. 05-20-BW147]